MGPCAKRRVVCTITDTNGRKFVGENLCASPQPTCPRQPGEGYEKCRTVCRQIGHAEEATLAQYRMAHGSVALSAHIEGHEYACDSCAKQLRNAHVNVITFGEAFLP